MSLIKIRKALETAFDNLPGIIPAVEIATSVAGGFTTVAPHKLVTGLVVRITGHSNAALNGEHEVVVTGESSFTLRHRTLNTPIASTAGGVGGVVTAQLTAWEGAAFKPLTGVPYQQVKLLPATPENPTFGSGMSRESGLFHVVLNYPPNQGMADITERAELIRSAFPRGSSFVADGLTVTVRRTPEILPAMPVDEVIKMGVRFIYQADVFN